MRAKLIGFPLSFDHGAVVYCLQNTSNGRIYIGKTLDFYARMTNHYSLLKNGKHTNKELQEDYNKGHDFLVICLYRYPDASKERRREHEEEIQGIIDNLEQEYISEFQAIERGYNKATSAIEYPPPEFGRPTLRPCEAYQAELEIRAMRRIV